MTPKTVGDWTKRIIPQMSGVVLVVEPGTIMFFLQMLLSPNKRYHDEIQGRKDMCMIRTHIYILEAI